MGHKCPEPGFRYNGEILSRQLVLPKKKKKKKLKKHCKIKYKIKNA